MIDRNEITFTIINGDEKLVVKTYENEYRNLMVLANNNIYLENFGECGGMGRCATCLVKISDLKDNANRMERNEMATIKKAGLSGSNFRLACQILITNDLNGMVVDIFREGY